MFAKPRGFTLIELMVTISIMAILFGIVVTATQATRKNARDGQRQGDLSKLQSTLQNYYGDQTTFPQALPAIGSPLTATSMGNTITYLNKMPGDPSPGNPAYCYLAYTSASCIGNPSCFCNQAGQTCQYYQLYAKLENPPSGASSYSVCSGTYNYLVTPP